MWTSINYLAYGILLLLLSLWVFWPIQRWKKFPILLLLPLALVKELGAYIGWPYDWIQYVLLLGTSILYLHTFKLWQLRLPYKLYTLVLCVAYCVLYGLPNHNLAHWLYLESSLYAVFYALLWRKKSDLLPTWMHRLLALFLGYDKLFELLLYLLLHTELFQTHQNAFWPFIIATHTIALSIFYYFLNQFYPNNQSYVTHR